VCELLRGEVPLSSIIQATAAPGLSLVTAGHCDAASIAALAQGRLHEPLQALRNQYDFVIIDTAPILPVADSLQISQHTDAVIFSVLREVSRLPKIYEAYERLSKLGVRLLGAVVAGTKQERYASGNYYSSYSNRTGITDATSVSA
jgi:Mrp family chromosome partitioning ATPase